MSHTATVKFDGSKTTVEAMKSALSKGGYPVSGNEKYLE
jgi:copper chaperone CopZ